jgi:hypothetical protein
VLVTSHEEAPSDLDEALMDAEGSGLPDPNFATVEQDRALTAREILDFLHLVDRRIATAEEDEAINEHHVSSQLENYLGQGRWCEWYPIWNGLRWKRYYDDESRLRFCDPMNEVNRDTMRVQESFDLEERNTF